MAEELELAAEAYNATKAKDDPDFSGTPLSYQAELRDRADGVVRSGITINNFEEKVKELDAKRKAEASKETDTPLGTKNAIDEQPLELEPLAKKK